MAAPKDGVRSERDLAYGPDALHRLDLHKQEGRTGMPIVVFLHGGAYVRGSRSVNTETEVYGNVSGRLKVSTSAERRAPSQALGPDCDFRGCPLRGAAPSETECGAPYRGPIKQSLKR